MTLLFAYTLFLALSLPALFPHWHMLYFAPFIVLTFPRCSFSSCLWWAFSCGFIVDLFSADARLGNAAFNYCLLTLVLHRYRFFFFDDRFSTLPLMTCLFTFLSALLQVVVFYFIGRPFTLTPQWVFNDLFYTPLQASLFAIVAFSLPALVIKILKRKYALFSRMRRS